jgi:hypothetical protein
VQSPEKARFWSDLFSAINCTESGRHDRHDPPDTTLPASKTTIKRIAEMQKRAEKVLPGFRLVRVKLVDDAINAWLDSLGQQLEAMEAAKQPVKAALKPGGVSA